MQTAEPVSISSEQTTSSSWADSLWFRIFLIAAFASGIFFRLGGLGNKMYSHDEAYASLYAGGYTGDEILTSIWDGKDKTAQDLQKFLQPGAGKDAGDVVSLLALYGPHQAPLFYLLAHFWMQIIGYSPAAMRGLSALFGLLALPAMYWLGKELFKSSRIALLCMALLAISPFHILFSQDARPYSLWSLATLLSCAALLWAMRKNGTGAWLVYSLTLILGVYTHQLFILVILFQGCYLAATRFLDHKIRAAGVLAAWLLAFLAYLPWLYYLIAGWRHAARQVAILSLRLPWPVYLQKWVLFFSSPLLDLDLPSGNLIPYILRALLLVLISAAVLFLARHGTSQQKIFILLMYLVSAGALIVPDLLLGGMRSLTGRYFVPVSMTTLLVMAYFLSGMLDRTPSRQNGKWAFLLVLLLAAGIASGINSLYAETWWDKELSRMHPQLIHEVDQDNSLLIVSGSHPTNLGDVLLLGFEVNSDVHLRVTDYPEQIEYGGNYEHIYWFPSSYEEFLETTERERLQVTEILPGTLWRIDGKSE